MRQVLHHRLLGKEHAAPAPVGQAPRDEALSHCDKLRNHRPDPALLPPIEARPGFSAGALTIENSEAIELTRGSAGVIGQDAKLRADGIGCGVKRATVTARGDAVLLIGVDNNYIIIQRAPGGIA